VRVEAAFANPYSLWWPISFRSFSKLWDSDGTTKMGSVIALLSDNVFKVAVFLSVFVRQGRWMLRASIWNVAEVASKLTVGNEELGI
jgi:hypothetical protein